MKFGFSRKFVLCCLLSFICSFMTFASSAVVVSFIGKVEVNRNNAWVTLAKGDKVYQGEMISTGFKSELILKYQDSIMKMGPLSRITLEKLSSSEKKDSVSVYLNTGSVRSTVNHSKNKRVGYISRNPVAVASVRGTDYMMLGDGSVICYSGGVNVIPASMFDAKIYGITTPADGSAGANDDQVKNADDVLPADGDTNSFTSGVDINPLEPNGVIITAGQYTNFQDGNGVMPAKGSYLGVSTEDKIKEGNVSLIGNETVVTGSGSNQNFSGSSSIPSAKTTADVIVNITIK